MKKFHPLEIFFVSFFYCEKCRFPSRGRSHWSETFSGLVSPLASDDGPIADFRKGAARGRIAFQQAAAAVAEGLPGLGGLATAMHTFGRDNQFIKVISLFRQSRVFCLSDGMPCRRGGAERGRGMLGWERGGAERRSGPRPAAPPRPADRSCRHRHHRGSHRVDEGAAWRGVTDWLTSGAPRARARPHHGCVAGVGPSRADPDRHPRPARPAL